MPTKIRVTCSKCNARYVLDKLHGGSMGRCHQCDERFILPIPNPEQLLEWAKSTTWQRLTQFVDHSGARGHEPAVIDKFVGIVEKRRWAEEHKNYREASPNGQSESRRDEVWNQTDRRIRRTNTLEELRKISHLEFERLVADVFSTVGYIASAVGESSEDGIDVKIWDSNQKFWAIAKCNRYAESNRVTASQIREFAGAYLLSGATKGFYFTTSEFTKNAARTAKGFSWLKIYDGKSFVRYLEEIGMQFRQLEK